MFVIFFLGFLQHLVCFVVHALCEEVEQDNCRSRPHLAKPDLVILIWPHLGKPNLVEFGQFCLTEFGQFFPFGVVGGGGLKGWGPEGVGALNPEKVGPEGLGGRRVGDPKGGRPKISRFFFSLSPAGNFILSSLGGLLVEFWWCLKRRGTFERTQHNTHNTHNTQHTHLSTTLHNTHTLSKTLRTKFLAKCGQHFETQILAKCGLAKCGHENDLAKFGPNAVLATCGLAKCGHDLTATLLWFLWFCAGCCGRDQPSRWYETWNRRKG